MPDHDCNERSTGMESVPLVLALVMPSLAPSVAPITRRLREQTAGR
jgi:hypothetical protein